MSQPGKVASAREFKAALCGNDPRQIDRVFGLGRRERLQGLTNVYPRLVTGADFSGHAPDLQGIEALFSTWGMDEDLALKVRELPNLKIFFYAAGSVRHFAPALLERGILVVSAWAVNAVPVARFTLAQILLSLKGYFRSLRELRLPGTEGTAPGIYLETVALLGFGQVGRAVAELLRPFELDVVVYDPFLPDAEALSLGLRKVTLEEAFSRALVVSNHLPDLESTRGMIRKEHFAALRPGAVFINTGRGATVDEAGLAEIFAARGDLTALLDVTHPEPPAPDSPLLTLGNIHISPHIAGSSGNEVVRMADACLEEFQAWRFGKPLRYQVTAGMLERMA